MGKVKNSPMANVLVLVRTKTVVTDLETRKIKLPAWTTGVLAYQFPGLPTF